MPLFRSAKSQAHTQVGMIKRLTLFEACAAGRVGMVQFLVDDESTDLDRTGVEGVTPICIAATWGYPDVVSLLLDAGCDPNARNESDNSTALHAAACQEHGKIIHLLLRGGADGTLEDGEGRTPVDFASVSDGLWPLFAARGYSRTPKDVLVAKRVIYKVDPALTDVSDATASGGGCPADSPTLPFYSRPGSAYVRSDNGGPSFGGRAGPGGSSGGSSLTQIPENGPIDPLEHLDNDDDSDDESAAARIRQLGLGNGVGAIYRDGF